MVRCRAIRAGAQLPRRMTAGASGFDVAACVDEPVVLAPGRWAPVPTGLVLGIPDGFEVQVRARSGLALRHGVGLVNAPGTIDSDYRGEVCVLLMNWGREPFTVRSGERIAQLVVQRVPVIEMEWGQVDDATDRGVGGFGHTGTQPVLGAARDGSPGRS